MSCPGWTKISVAEAIGSVGSKKLNFDVLQPTKTPQPARERSPCRRETLLLFGADLAQVGTDVRGTFSEPQPS